MSDLELKLSMAFLQQTIEEFKKEIDEAKKLIADRQYSLEERWNTYLVIRPYLETEGFYMTFNTLDSIREVSWYDDFYLERYAVMDLDQDFVDEAVEKFYLSEEQVDSLKEEILESGCGAFENDW